MDMTSEYLEGSSPYIDRLMYDIGKRQLLLVCVDSPETSKPAIEIIFSGIESEVEKFSDDQVVASLRRHLFGWKQDDTNIIELADLVERFFVNSRIVKEEIYNHLYRLWSNFKKEAIDSIGGMTMNERLYLLGLFQRFESSQSEAAKKVIYAKLCANT